MTQTGLSLGTPQYMSPEQAMGERTIDARSDIYALGAVTYEMLVGEPPFTGPSVQAIVARVMTEEPRGIATQRKAVPAHVEYAVMRALEKLPADRFATATGFGAALADGTATHARTTVMRSAPRISRRRGAFTMLAVGAAGIAIGLAAGLLASPRRPRPAPLVLRYAIPLSDSTSLDMASSGVLAFAPDGSRFAYASRAGLMIRSLDQLEPVTVPGGVRGDSPFFSPDGLWLGFTEGARLLKVSLAGGDPIVICESCSGYQFQWGTDDTVRYHTAPPGNLNSRVLMAVPARGGQPRELANPHSSGEAYRAPILLPGTRTVLFWLFTETSSRLAALDLEPAASRGSTSRGSAPSGSMPGSSRSAGRTAACSRCPSTGRGRPRVRPSPSRVTCRNPTCSPRARRYLPAAPSSTPRPAGRPPPPGPGRALGLAAPMPGQARLFARPRFSPDGRRAGARDHRADGSEATSGFSMSRSAPGRASRPAGSTTARLDARRPPGRLLEQRRSLVAPVRRERQSRQPARRQR